MNIEFHTKIPGPLVLVFAVLFVLKLTERVDWSWWWIAAPLWAPFAIAVAVGCVRGAKP